MFGLSMDLLIPSIGVFLVTALPITILLTLMFKVEESDTFAVIFMVACIAGGILGHTKYTALERELVAKEAIPTEVADILDVDVKTIKYPSIHKEGFDYTLKVGKDLVGVDYNYNEKAVEALVLDDKYIYEREEK